MEQNIARKARIYTKKHKKRRWLYRTLSAAGACAVFWTTYALILPAITMENEPFCGLIEHEHDESCYTVSEIRKFICMDEFTGEEMVYHLHNEFCYHEDGTLLCILPEYVPHEHTDECWQIVESTDSPEIAESESVSESHEHTEECYVRKQGEQICELEEFEGHTHGESCYGELAGNCTCLIEENHKHSDACFYESELICTNEEGHVHSLEAGCYESGEVPLVCDLEESGEHIHSEACWEWNNVLICGFDEINEESYETPVQEVSERILICEYSAGIEHIHTEECIVAEEAEKVLMCGMEEHTHDEILCFIDEDTDIETMDDWEATLPGLDSEADIADNLLAVAESQLEYTESNTNIRVGVSGKISHYSRYGAWSGFPYGEWNTTFTAFCLHYAGAANAYTVNNADKLAEIMAGEELFVQADNEQYLPKYGDILFLDTDLDGEADRTAIISDCDGETVTAIEGDVDGQVMKVPYSLRDDQTILGYGIWNSMDVLTLEELLLIEEINAQIADLPTSEDVKDMLDSFEADGNFEGYIAYYQEISEQVKVAQRAYDTLEEILQKFVENADILNDLMWLAETELIEYPILTDDSAVVISLTAESSGNYGTVTNGTSIDYLFTYTTASYTDIHFREGRIKFEFVLPLSEEQAAFDLSAMEWLDQPVLNTEFRETSKGEELCQVLTGYMYLSADSVGEAVIPGSGTVNAAVSLTGVPHGGEVTLLCSAAMEHSAWDFDCATHGVAEKLTVAGECFTVDASLSPEEQKEVYEGYLAEIEDLTENSDTDELRNRIDESYETGELSEEDYCDLCERLNEVPEAAELVGEMAVGDLWKSRVLRTWTLENDYSNSANMDMEPILMNSAHSPMMLMSEIPASDESKQQIIETGHGVNEDEAVYVSKTIEGTEYENVFDITLQIVTQDKIETVYQDPNMAVVIVMDISNTMNSKFTGTNTTRYEAAVEAAADFIDEFQQNAGAVSKIGYVAFNSHAHEIFDLQTCNTQAQATALKNEMSTDTWQIISTYEHDKDGNPIDHDRFTNIEAGLKMANDMLKDAKNANKYIIFLSDGFPTTYIKEGYTGYDTYDGNIFYDAVELYRGNVRPCSAGTSYSDEAAIRARKMAESIKDSGVSIFSIGVDVGGQTIEKYVNRFIGSNMTVVDRRNPDYELGSADDPEAFKQWLEGTAATGGIGSGDGYYYDSDNASELQAAYEDIFEKLMILNGQSSRFDWIAADPLPKMGTSSTTTVEFIGFYDREHNLLDETTGQPWTSLTGTKYGENQYDENTVTYSNNKIEWDLKKSLYYAIPVWEGDEIEGSGTVVRTEYTFNLKYRVRLRNEESVFVENTELPTNDTTTLTYRIIEVENGVTHISKQKEVEFPIPSVKGYLAELAFHKQDTYGNLVEGAEFTLSHDTENCGYCRGDGSSHVEIGDRVQTVTAENNGDISFTNIPSGHTYRLTETKVPEGYLHPIDCEVVVAYNEITVDGEKVPDNWIVVNEIAYELPETGGSGTILYSAGGVTLMFTAALLLMNKYSSRRRKNSASS